MGKHGKYAKHYRDEWKRIPCFKQLTMRRNNRPLNQPPPPRPSMNVEMGIGGPLLPPFNLPLMALLAPPPPPPPPPSTTCQTPSNTPRTIAPSTYTAPPPPHAQAVYTAQPPVALPEMFDASRPPPPIVAHAQNGLKRRAELQEARSKVRKPEPAEVDGPCETCFKREIRITKLQEHCQKMQGENESKSAYLKRSKEKFENAKLLLKSGVNPLLFQIMNEYIEMKPSEPQDVFSQLEQTLNRRHRVESLQETNILEEPEILQALSTLIRKSNLVKKIPPELLKGVLELNSNNIPTTNGVNVGASTSRGATRSFADPSVVRSSDGSANVRQTIATGTTYSMPPPSTVGPPPSAVGLPPSAVRPPPAADVPPVLTAPLPVMVAAPGYTSTAANAGASSYVAPAPYGPAVATGTYYQPGPSHQYGQPYPSAHRYPHPYFPPRQ